MLLNKKRGLLVLYSFFLALLIPIVSAQWEGVYSMFSFLFGAGENVAFMFLKAGVWIILFAIIFGASTKMFSGNKGISTIFSIVFSLIAVRFIPNEYIYYIGSAYGVLGIVLLILAIIGGTLLILNSYFPIKQHKAFGVVWALFYFFIAWIFHQLTDIITGIYQLDELLLVIGPWGKRICIVLGIACLIRAFSGTSSYARTNQPRYEPQYQSRGGDRGRDQGRGRDRDREPQQPVTGNVQPQPQQPTYIGGPANANQQQSQSQTQTQSQSQKQKQKQKDDGQHKNRGAASFDLYIDGKRYGDRDSVQHITDLRNVNETNFLIRNGGTGGTLYWRAAASKGLEVQPKVGKLKRGIQVLVTVRVTDRNVNFIPHVTVIAKRGTTGDARTLVRLRVAKAFIKYRLN